MSQKRNGAQTRELIFEACGRILQRDGLVNLTIDNVAAEAGLSKGGLFYHFPSKEALIEGLFNYHNDKFEARLQELAQAEGDEPGAWLRAYAKASIEQIIDPANAGLYASLFAAGERYDGAYQLLRNKYVLWQQQVEQSGLDPAWAALVRFAVDGLWFAEMHQYAPPSETRRAQI
ncbi:MAG: TetR/AcrR family transcriptional regulator, partial [Anaerolineae bacterium]|nr:TetR/AcrR family transcriptional regulator [Anaerolineae bacterium]